jgi:hypothetical protein
LVVWFVAAGTRERAEDQIATPTTPGYTPETTPGVPPSGAPEATAPQDRVIEREREVVRERPVEVYIQERPRETPRVVVIPEGQSAPARDEGYRAVDLPGEFRLFNREWKASQGTVVTADDLDLVTADQQVEGNTIYVARGDSTPYDALYIEVMGGSRNYIRYEPER